MKKTSDPKNLQGEGYWFKNFSQVSAQMTGHPIAFLFALIFILIWAVTGPLFGFSDTWQLVINTSTSVLTFLMVFLIQSTQNRESRATQLKLDELIRTSSSNNDLIDSEELTDGEQEQLRQFYLHLKRSKKTGKPVGN